ncbi:hypothetical protein E4U60_006137 [Claviceps pazoutovae]|uniref:Uncharacterized protein n=1 Tax=Claviceps pazoutovae TaxID=1649127 RepID=A0A9P7MGY1_9HYPO|nr:hypothetical protein E4U60_006137 [Claviceps pazoutovae]
MAVLGCEGAASSTSSFPRVDRTYLARPLTTLITHQPGYILPDLALGSLAASALVLAAHTARSCSGPRRSVKGSASMKQHEKGERHRSQSEIVMGSHGKFWAAWPSPRPLLARL